MERKKIFRSLRCRHRCGEAKEIEKDLKKSESLESRLENRSLQAARRIVLAGTRRSFRSFARRRRASMITSHVSQGKKQWAPQVRKFESNENVSTSLARKAVPMIKPRLSSLQNHSTTYPAAAQSSQHDHHFYPEAKETQFVLPRARRTHLAPVEWCPPCTTRPGEESRGESCDGRPGNGSRTRTADQTK